MEDKNKKILKLRIEIANLQSWLDCFEQSAPVNQVNDCKQEIENIEFKISKLKTP